MEPFIPKNSLSQNIESISKEFIERAKELIEESRQLRETLSRLREQPLFSIDRFKIYEQIRNKEE